METVAVSSVSAFLDKHGPMGAALLTVLGVLWWFMKYLLPAMIETQGKRLDNLTSAITKKSDDHELAAAKRQGEIITRLDDKVIPALGEIKKKLSEEGDGGRDETPH